VCVCCRVDLCASMYNLNIQTEIHQNKNSPHVNSCVLVEDDVGEETIAQTSTAEQSGPL